MIAGIHSWLQQPDVRAGIVRALWRRVRWRWHWRFHSGRSMRVGDWWRGLEIHLACSGSSAVAYYRDFELDPIVCAMERLLRPGMKVLDVGAHVGAYSLVASRFVEEAGRVIAMEPQPALADLIRLNTQANGMGNIAVEECAVGGACGEVRFESDSHTRGGWVSQSGHGEGSFSVPMLSLDAIRAREGRFDFIKLDAAGFEPAVIEGAGRMLAEPEAPDLILKFYNPSVIMDRLGVADDRQRKILEGLGFSLLEHVAGSWVPFTRTVSEYGVAILATRQPGRLAAASR